MSKKAYIIGAGPGDEELLTLKAINALQKCTAVLYDRLVGNNILNYLNDDCEIYYCGKEPGCHYKTQEEINESIVELAKKGHIVGRVKGGDPYVFGRGGEEDGIHTLQEWYEPKEAWLGPQRDLLLMILLAGAEGVCEPAIEKR